MSEHASIMMMEQDQKTHNNLDDIFPKLVDFPPRHIGPRKKDVRSV